MTTCQTQEVKQRFAEVLRLAATEGDQIITRNGVEVAAVIDIARYRRLRAHDQQRPPAYPGLFPPLVDEEIAEVIDAVVAERRLGVHSRPVVEFD
ncbi:MAG: type II toxin-antitoxin system prevent-host-death family antitoxin [Micrococcales bacterium]|nr:type II toxin-antitoxin system prevent-host-death family antitoxin [Micrococcales bacterium]